ncbi:MAG: hypothetical protein IKQ60_09040 [Candidatus Methanomethylophilaceae archaeon]|nr:hypothetical protein [Candidatus Methanomethylophilaceae archaeon]
MAFIKVQKLVRNEDGSVRSGSAVIMDVVYVKDGKYHSKQVQREKLGKVVSLDDSKRRGVFMSPTRGLVGYDVDKDCFFDPDDSPVEAPPEKPATSPKAAPKKASGKHKVFGDVYLAFETMRSTGLLSDMKGYLADDSLYEGTIVRMMQSIASDGSRIPLKQLLERSFAYEMFSKESTNDKKYYHRMGSASAKAIVRDMLATDRVPFYTDATDYRGPRMMLEFDGVGGKPVGCDPVVDPGRWALDHGGDGVAILGEEYVTESLFKAYGPESGMTFIAAMPSKKGLPYKDLCQKALKHVGEKECVFEKDGRELFAMRKKIELFGRKAYAYVVADMGRFETPSPMFQVLVSNKGGSADLVAEAYASGLVAEASCRAAHVPADVSVQEACGMAVCGFLADHMRGVVSDRLWECGMSPSEALGTAQSVMCSVDGDAEVEKASSAASKMFKSLGIKLPDRLSFEDYRDSLLNPAKP